MIILVDYDNLPRLDRKRSLDQLITKLVEKIGAARLASTVRARVKLYGGWFENHNLTNRAQLLSAQVSSLFPRVISTFDGTVHASPIVRVDMGYSLEIEPAFNLEGTFRRRGMPQGLRCEAPPIVNCANHHSCPLNQVHSIVTSEECPDVSCHVTLNDVLSKHEQKLVDTMLVADMIHLAGTGAAEIAVVSSDDDLWIGIKSALLIGATVYHVHTIPGRKTHNRYKAGAGSKYVELNLF